jgi:hypothetical protein
VEDWKEFIGKIYTYSLKILGNEDPLPQYLTVRKHSKNKL